MRRRKLARVLLALVLAALAGAASAAGCSAASDQNTFDDDDGGGGAGASATTTTSAGGAGVGGEGGTILNLPDAGADATPDVPINPCGTECGPEELCDEIHTGLDDDCDGLVDEICQCPTAGAAHFCFKGDPSYRNTPGCYDGTQTCTENGTWGPCIGGVHADENCFENNVMGCHPISAVPFQDVNLKDGTGNFSNDAVPGTEVWTVTCPPGVNPCPAVTGMNPPDDFKPLQSGEYTVTYTKGLMGGGTDSCTYPLFIGAKGLRVELEWEHDLGGMGVDLDLHLHKPNNTAPWAIGGSPEDCGFANCTIDDFVFGFSDINWFPNGNMPPDPVNWYLDPVFEKNTCFFSPRGAGQDWQDYGMGCHNPRLDIDNINCDPASVDPNDFNFCAPENINVDYPPTGQWFRIGVHYYYNHGHTYTVHPRVKIYCDGALAADLGSVGYYTPEMPVAFAAANGGTIGNNLFWMVADVAFEDDECGTTQCRVEPLYFDSQKSPYFVTQTSAQTSFGPPYPP